MHLLQIASHSDKNLASVENLAKVFGPTIFRTDEDISMDAYAKMSRQILVTKDLILNCFNIFQLDAEEISAKMRLDEAKEQTQKVIRSNG